MLLDRYREHIHTRPTCPFCGVHLCQEDIGLSGATAAVCRGCSENLHHYTASYAVVMAGDTAPIEVWHHIPAADDWRPTTHDYAPVFLDPPYRPCDLSRDTQQALAAFIENTFRDALESAPHEAVADKYLTALNPNRTVDSTESTGKQLRDQLERPVILTTQRLYTPDIARVEDVTTQTQTTLQ